MKKILLLLCLAGSLECVAQQDTYMGIVPAPVSVKKSKGEFRLTAETILLTDSPAHKAVKFFTAYLHKAGLNNAVTDLSQLDKNRKDMKNAITLTVNFKADLPAEGYQLFCV